MSHENSPDNREQDLQRNRALMAAYVPIFREIASQENLAKDPTESLAAYTSVVLAGGDYFVVAVSDITKLTLVKSGPQQSTVQLERLLAQPNKTSYNTIRRYSYEAFAAASPSEAITASVVKVGDTPEAETHESYLLYDPKETLDLFSQFATVDVTGNVERTCEVIERKQAQEIVRSHYRKVVRLSMNIDRVKSGKRPRITGSLLDRILS